MITREEILRSGVLSIPEALRLAPNMQVTQLNSSEYSNGARGFAGAPDVQNFSNKILILIDGRSVYSPLFSGVAYDMQDVLMDDIDRIEVISGPGATLWGANAMNGVINIITRKAADTKGALVRLDARRRRAGDRRCATAATLGDDGAFRVYAKWFDRGATDFADGGSAQDDWSKLQAGFRTEFGTGQQHVHRAGRLPARRAEFRRGPRRGDSPAPTCSAAGNMRATASTARAGVLRSRASATIRRAASHTTSTPTTSSCSRARKLGARHHLSGVWAGAPTTTTPSTTCSHSCPTIARSN